MPLFFFARIYLFLTLQLLWEIKGTLVFLFSKLLV